ncbi:hypothetical protein BASA83_006373 [Batrachochytrium salamandrivorans]|nr:hypothetical protein BASA83_006373 [Batrachochytrium salamandrivorans]
MADFEDPFAASVWADVETPNSLRPSQALTSHLTPTTDAVVSDNVSDNVSATVSDAALDHIDDSVAARLSSLVMEPSSGQDPLHMQLTAQSRPSSSAVTTTTTTTTTTTGLSKRPMASPSSPAVVAPSLARPSPPVKVVQTVIPNPLFGDPLSVSSPSAPKEQRVPEATMSAIASSAIATAHPLSQHSTHPAFSSTPSIQGAASVDLGPLGSASAQSQPSFKTTTNAVVPHPLDNPFQSLADPLSQMHQPLSTSGSTFIKSATDGLPHFEDETAVGIKSATQPLFDPLLSPQSSTSLTRGDSYQQGGSPVIEEKKPSPTSEGAMYLFDINVTEPFKVGETLSSHISYKLKVKTSSPNYRNPEFVVNRRFRDFLWLYNQLVSKYPGAIIPPVPEKHAIGRFQEEFVEARRLALERFIRKVVAHPTLQPDADVRLFLESETFSFDKRADRKGSFMGAFTETTPQINQAFPKVPDNDASLESRRIQTENMEIQLKSLAKALELLMKQRRDLALSILEMGDSLVGLANVEKSPLLSRKLLRLGSIHKTIRDLQEKQAKEDLNHIFVTVEEYIRIIGSVKVAYSTRLKSYSSLIAAEANLAKRNDSLTKLAAASRIRYDKIALAKNDLTEAETALEDSSKSFTAMTAFLTRELERIDHEKIADFTESMKLFLASLVQTQKKIIETWQSFFVTNNDDQFSSDANPDGHSSEQQQEGGASDGAFNSDPSTSNQTPPPLVSF